MNKQSNPKRAATMLMVSALLLAACEQKSALDARATVPAKPDAQQFTPDPALNNLETVAHHG